MTATRQAAGRWNPAPALLVSYHRPNKIFVLLWRTAKETRAAGGRCLRTQETGVPMGARPGPCLAGDQGGKFADGKAGVEGGIDRHGGQAGGPADQQVDFPRRHHHFSPSRRGQRL